MKILFTVATLFFIFSASVRGQTNSVMTKNLMFQKYYRSAPQTPLVPSPQEFNLAFTSTEASFIMLYSAGKENPIMLQPAGFSYYKRVDYNRDIGYPTGQRVMGEILNGISELLWMLGN